jgi:rhamnosyl/mannosyltransferase
MACGKPTVVCELGNGVNYLNQAGRTSLTVPPRDVDALADAVDQMLSDETRRGQMGDEASLWVRETFSIKRMRRLTADVYSELI